MTTLLQLHRMAALLFALCLLPPAFAQTGTAFSFQGRLYDSGVQVEGEVALRITPWDSAVAGTALAPPLETGPLSLDDGVFSTLLDFGAAVFLGTPVWLAIEADTGGGYVLLEPRQAVVPTPYAMHAQSVAVDGVDEFALQDGAVGAAKIAPGAVGATQVDASQVQRRIAPACAAGMAIAAVAEDGATSCVPTAGDDGDWEMPASGLLYTDKRVRVGGLGPTAPKMIVHANSGITSPQLELRETELDYARLNLSTVGTPAGEPTHVGFWSIAARTRPASDGGPAADQVNFFNNRSGDAMTLYGNGWMGLGPAAFTPDAPLMVTSNGFHAPGIGPFGRGDFHIGNSALGLSFGVATGGGGVGAARIWTDGGLVNQLFLGSAAHGDVLAIKDGFVGIGTTGPTAELDIDGDVRVRGMADALATGNRDVQVTADGSLVAASDAPVEHAINIDAVALTPENSSASYAKKGLDFVGAYGNSGAFSMFAPVALPRGAIITGLTCTLRDESAVAGADVECYLGGRHIFGSEWMINAQAMTSGSSPGWQVLTDPTINGGAVNPDYAYFVQVRSMAWQGTTTAVLGMRITYTQ